MMMPDHCRKKIMFIHDSRLPPPCRSDRGRWTTLYPSGVNLLVFAVSFGSSVSHVSVSAMVSRSCSHRQPRLVGSLAAMPSSRNMFNVLASNRDGLECLPWAS